jgi:serine/threonine-protein kinase HipA
MVSLERRDLALTVGSYGRTASLYNLISQSERFGISEKDAREEVRKVAAVVAEWRAGFSACGVSREDIEFIAPAMLPTCFLNEVPPRPVL